MDQQQTLRMMKAEVDRRGLSIPPTWNDALVMAMLGSVSGANIIYGMVCLLNGRHITSGDFVREMLARTPRKARKRQRREMMAILGRAPVTPKMLRTWHRLARIEGNPRAGEDMRVDRTTFERSDGVFAFYDLMDNGDAVLRLHCSRCGATSARRWRAVDIKSVDEQAQRQEATR